MRPQCSTIQLDLHWPAASAPPLLRAGEIHVWRFTLQSDSIGRLEPLLADDERRRAERFLFDRHRMHFVVGRARTRQLLGYYASMPPEQLRFRYDNLGKPRFADTTLNQIRFNFSNSTDVGLLAITHELEIGIDLERIRPMNDMLGLANRYYGSRETAKLLALPNAQRPPAFFRCWTRKEAFLKAVGKGLTLPLNRVEVSLLSHEPCQIVHIDSTDDAANAWRLDHLDPASGYVGAVAIRDLSRTIRCFTFAK